MPAAKTLFSIAFIALALSAEARAAETAPQAVAPQIPAVAEPAQAPSPKSTALTATVARSVSALPEKAQAILDKLGQYTENAQEIIKNGFGYLGVDYHRGGTSMETGFDCSGLVRRVFGDTFGLELPHNARAISKEGTKISAKDLKPGDLVFFNTLRRTFSHVGIYVGNNLFLHAPSSGGGVRLDDLRERYWVRHFNGARRIEMN